MTRLLALLVLAACHAPAIAHTAQAETAGPVTVLYTLTDATGLAVRGALTELDGRLYGLAGERGPNGTPSCSSGALWQTPEHTQRCPGTLFSIQLDGSGFRVDHAFTQLDVTGRNADGYHPYGTLAVGRDGRLYGVAQMGGSPPEPTIPGFGVLFAYGPPSADPLDRPGSYEVLHTFFAEPRAADGEHPMGALAMDPAGNVFGTAKGGGATSTGTVWEWSPGGTFRWAALPGENYGGVTLAGGLLHGTTWAPGAGVYFTVSPETMQVRVVDSFPALPELPHANDNTPISAPLALRSGGVVATREFGGAYGTGLIAMLTPSGIWALRESDDLGPVDVAPRFANATGGMPNGQIAESATGAIYGTMQYGGAAGTGAIYCVVRGSARIRVLWSWPDAAYPYGGLMLGSDGAYYGVTFGTSQVFRFVPPPSAAELCY